VSLFKYSVLNVKKIFSLLDVMAQDVQACSRYSYEECIGDSTARLILSGYG